MVTKAEIDAYQSVIDGLSTVATAQIRNLLLELDDPNPIAFRDALLATYPELMAPYMSAAGEVAAQWYTELRDSAGIRTAFAAIPAENAPQRQLESGLRYSLSPLFQPQKFIGSDVLSLLAGFSQKMIANAGRETISGNAFKDPTRVAYARIPRAGCCSFCAMLASRGAVYKSEQTAGGIGNRYHDNCRCVATPVFRGGDNAFVKRTEEFYLDQYKQVVQTKTSAYSKRNPEQKEFGAVDIDATLAEWRKTFGTK